MSWKGKVLLLSILFVSAQAFGNDGIIIRKNQRT